jgi:hypothetical protein
MGGGLMMGQLAMITAQSQVPSGPAIQWASYKLVIVLIHKSPSIFKRLLHADDMVRQLGLNLERCHGLDVGNAQVARYEQFAA